MKTKASSRLLRDLAIPLIFLLALAGCARQGAAPEGRVPLLGTQWRAVEAAGRSVGFLDGQKLDVTLVLYPGGHFRGSGGCNAFSGTYMLKGKRIRLPVVATTRMACAKGVLEQERSFLNALRASATWSVVGHRLLLFDRNGRKVAELAAVARP